MTLDVVRLGPEYFPEPDRSQAVASGYIYVGVPDLDPTIPANQKQVTLQQEDGSLVEVAQPVRTNAGGVPVYNGSPVTLLVSGDYSLTVLSSSMSQLYYVPSKSGGGSSTQSVYYPDYNEADQGVTGGGETVKAYLDTIGSKEATIVFEHGSGGSTTEYNFTTGLSVPDNVNLVFQNGARIVGSGTLEVNGPVDAGAFQIFDGSVSYAGDAQYKTSWRGGDLLNVANDVGSNSVDILVDSNPATLTANVSFPRTASLEWLNGCNTSGAFTLTINGGLKAGLYQLFDSATTVAGLSEVYPEWFGVFKDGIQNDSPGIQNAVDALTGGGTIYFDSASVYSIGTQINVSSEYPIKLISDMRVPNLTDPPSGGYFKPLSGISGSMFRIEAPTSRFFNPKSLIRGLAFLDDSNISATPSKSKRTIPIDAALDLYDFDYGTVEECYFSYLQGSAIKIDRAIKATLHDFKIEFCGDVGKPALWLNASSALLIQSVTIYNFDMEVNYDDDYIAINSNSQDITIRDGYFESDTSETTSQQTYIDCDGLNVKITGCNFNRLNSVNVNISSSYGILTDCTFNGNNTDGRVVWSGNFGIMSKCILNSAVSNTGTQINVSGVGCSLSDITVTRGGNVIISGADSVGSNITLNSLDSTETHCLILSGVNSSYNNISINDPVNGSISGVSIPATSISFTGGKLDGIGGSGIDLSGGVSVISGTLFRVITGNGINNSGNNSSTSALTFQAITGSDINDTGTGNVAVGNASS